MAEIARFQRLDNLKIKMGTPDAILMTLTEMHRRVDDSVAPEVVTAALKVAALSMRLKESSPAKPKHA